MPFTPGIPYLLWGPDFPRESVEFVKKDVNNRAYFFDGANGPVEPHGITAANLRQLRRIPTATELASPTLWYITVSDEDAEQPFNPHNNAQTTAYYENENEVQMIGGRKSKAKKTRGRKTRGRKTRGGKTRGRK